MEYGHDFYTNLPLGCAWDHVGHTIAISSLSYEKNCNYDTFTRTPTILAYKFGKKTVKSSKSKIKALKSVDLNSRGKKVQGKLDHNMESYLHALEHFMQQQLPWVSSFVGEEGAGITTADNEERSIV